MIEKKGVYELNKYDLSGKYGIGWTSNTNKEFYFDLDDYDLIRKYTWYEYINKSTGYHSLRSKDNNTKKHILMTTLLGCKFYDHIDRNPLNCCRNNLRVATQRQNTINRSKMKNNTSGVTGVMWDKREETWIASISVDGKRITLGKFKDKNKAIRTRLIAEMLYFKEFAPQKHLYEEYGLTDLLPYVQ